MKSSRSWSTCLWSSHVVLTLNSAVIDSGKIGKQIHTSLLVLPLAPPKFINVHCQGNSTHNETSISTLLHTPLDTIVQKAQLYINLSLIISVCLGALCCSALTLCMPLLRSYIYMQQWLAVAYVGVKGSLRALIQVGQIQTNVQLEESTILFRS